MISPFSVCRLLDKFSNFFFYSWLLQDIPWTEPPQKIHRCVPPGDHGTHIQDLSDDTPGSAHERDDPMHHQYTPPRNDHEDELLDQLISDLQAAAQQEQREDLAEDDPVVSLADDILQATEYEIEETLGSHEPEEEDPPVYEGSKRRVGIAMLLICVFMIRFRLSDETIQFLLTLIQLLLPDNNRLIKSLYGLKKYLGKFIHAPNLKYYCARCYAHVEKTAVKCTNEHCLQDLTSSGSMAYFVQHSIISQLSVLFKRKSFTESIRTNRFAHFRNNPQKKLMDVYDGTIYQQLFNTGILNNENNLSFAISTDGVQIFKSSKVSMWPVYMLINELPLSQRKARENIIFYGIWISPKKPVMWSFLKPLYEELNVLEKGYEFEDHDGIKFTCQAALITCTCDLPAKCLVTNSMQFNGSYGCWHCLQKGETFRTEGGGNCHVYPFNEGNPSGPKRTAEDIEKDVKKVVEKINSGNKNYVTNGIKGPSWLMFLTFFNIVDGFVIDYMHGICEGVTKLLVKLWFTNTYKNESFSCFDKRQNVSNFLTTIKPTINITRVPRSLDDLAFWKASEFRNFLLYWSIPILKNCLSRIHFVHFCLLVRAIYLLSQESISQDDIVLAESCLFEFVKNFEELYSRRYMTMNIHQIVHLADVVRATGPLFAINSFVFEDINGFIVSHIHGTQGIDTQVINTINLIQAIPILHEKYAPNDDEVLVFINRMHGISHKLWERIGDGIYRLDSTKETKIAIEDLQQIKQTYVVRSNCLDTWKRIYLKNSASYVYAQSYKKLVRRNQSIIKYSQNGRCRFGLVLYFAEVTNPVSSSDVSIAVVNPFHIGSYSPEDHIHLAKFVPNKIEVVELKDIVESCLHVQVDSEHYICEFPNKIEKD